MLSSKDRILTFDIEGVGLLDKIREGHPEDLHIIHAKDKMTGERFTFFDDFEKRQNAVFMDEYDDVNFKTGGILQGIKFLQQAKVLIIQNGIGFDFIALEKVTNGKFKRDHFRETGIREYPFATMDTFVMSSTLDPCRPLPREYNYLPMPRPAIGPHSIAAHGIRMGRFKPDHEDWSKLTPEMIHRVEEDVEIGEDFYDFLMFGRYDRKGEFKEGDWAAQVSRPHPVTGRTIKQAYLCELRCARAMANQAQRGFAIDVGFVNTLLKELDSKIEATFEAFHPHMPPRIIMKKRSKDQLLKEGKEIVDFWKLCPEVGKRLANEWYKWNLENPRGSKLVTKHALVKKDGSYVKAITDMYPEARGFFSDHKDPLVAGPFTPVEFEDVPLGNRDAVKEILYERGWRGVNFNDTETDYIEENDGELPKPWSGKIDEKSMEAWAESGSEVPDWCKGIAEWYILKSRRSQILNPDDPIYYHKMGKWKKQPSKKEECRGILPQARLYSKSSKYGGESAQDFYEREGHWPTKGHWRVPAIAFHAATNTFRMRHKVVVNIPSRGLYGKEMRRIFIAGPGKLLLGCDGAGLELRMLSHFMNDLEYTETVLSGDIHSYNQEMAGLPTRDMAKTFIYAFLYGSGIPNLARQLGLDVASMEAAVARFKEKLPKLASLLERVQRAGEKFKEGYLLAVDGRWGRIRKRSFKLALHTALNVLLQMTGSLLMKYGHISAEDLAVELGLIESTDDFPIVAHVHDEAQMEVSEDEVETTQYLVDDWKIEEKREHFDDKGRMWSAPEKLSKEGDKILVERKYHPLGEAYAKSLTYAGELLKLNVPCAGEYKIGTSWADTH